MCVSIVISYIVKSAPGSKYLFFLLKLKKLISFIKEMPQIVKKMNNKKISIKCFLFKSLNRLFCNLFYIVLFFVNSETIFPL